MKAREICVNNQKKSKKQKNGLKIFIVVILFAMLGSGLLSVVYTLMNFL